MIMLRHRFDGVTLRQYFDGIIFLFNHGLSLMGLP